MGAVQTNGISSLSLQRLLDISSYPMPWTMLHRLRSVLVTPGRDRLTDTVGVDETKLCGTEQRLSGDR